MGAMQTARLVPVVLACLALGAHLLRSGLEALGWLIAASPLLLLAGRLWTVRVLQALLALGALEWLRTLARLVGLDPAQTTTLLIFSALPTASSASSHGTPGWSAHVLHPEPSQFHSVHRRYWWARSSQPSTT